VLLCRQGSSRDIGVLSHDPVVEAEAEAEVEVGPKRRDYWFRCGGSARLQSQLWH
jgi:hypothetical protein